MFAKSWSERTGAVTCERMAQRVFTLHRLIPPTGVPGVVRRAGSRDIELLHGGELISLTRRPVDCAATTAPGTGHQQLGSGKRRVAGGSRWAAGGLGVRDRSDRCHVSDRAGVDAAAASRARIRQCSYRGRHELVAGQRRQARNLAHRPSTRSPMRYTRASGFAPSTMPPRSLSCPSPDCGLA